MVSGTASAVTYLPTGVFLLPPLEARRAIYLVGGRKGKRGTEMETGSDRREKPKWARSVSEGEAASAEVGSATC